METAEGIHSTFALCSTVQGHVFPAPGCVFLVLPGHDRTAHVDVFLPFDPISQAPARASLGMTLD